MKKILISLAIAAGFNGFSQTPVYLPLGDSYTICEGLAEKERWPNLLVNQLGKEELPVTLTENPARTGYTTDNLIKHELPFLKTTHPDVITLLIGVNDYVQGYDTAHFHKNLVYILNEVQKELKVKTNIILIAIPDYSVTPAGATYANGRNVAKDLRVWNLIIKTEASNRKLPFIDIFPTTQKMKDNNELIGADGLHPSGKEVALWAALIYPELKKMVKDLK